MAGNEVLSADDVLIWPEPHEGMWRLLVYIEDFKGTEERARIECFQAVRALIDRTVGEAARLRRALGPACRVSLRPDVSRVGGGAFPERDLPTTLVCLEPAAMSATALKQALLETTPPVLGRLEEKSFCLDPRTLLPEDLPRLTALLRQLLAG